MRALRGRRRIGVVRRSGRRQLCVGLNCGHGVQRARRSRFSHLDTHAVLELALDCACRQLRGRHPGAADPAGVIGHSVPPHGVGDPREPPREGHHGNLLPAPPREAARPGPERGRLGRLGPEQAPGRSDQQPSHATVTCLRNGPDVALFPGAPLARYQAQVGFELVCGAKQRNVVDRGDDGARRNWADGRCRGEPCDEGIRRRQGGATRRVEGAAGANPRSP